MPLPLGKRHLCSYKLNYSSEIAPVGHAPAQVPQEMQVSASITYCPSPSEIALTGHSPSQVPQDTQASEITYAMINTSLYSIHLLSFYTIFFKYSSGKCRTIVQNLEQCQLALPNRLSLMPFKMTFRAFMPASLESGGVS